MSDDETMRFVPNPGVWSAADRTDLGPAPEREFLKIRLPGDPDEPRREVLTVSGIFIAKFAKTQT